jgi:12-oxophytodienoic acid reductase
VPCLQVYKGTVISAGGHTAASGGEAVASGHCDLVCYGRCALQTGFVTC